MDSQLLRGVNLGGWLVLEKWITPSLFKGLAAEDEYSFVKELGKLADKKLKDHYGSYITKNDFKWLADNGLNAVRIPIGYWLFGDEPPFVKNISYLDFAFEQAEKNSLKVIIDFHAAPGSQNGWQHSGRKGPIDWPNEENIAKSLNVIERLSKRYSSADSLFGIELINEPHWKIPKKILLDYYRRGYENTRKYCRKDIAVIFSDSFRPKIWQDAFPADYENILLDIHLYEVPTAVNKSLLMPWRYSVKRLCNQWRSIIDKVQNNIPVIVGEWSTAFSYKNTVIDKNVIRQFFNSQLDAFAGSQGWFYWTYKTETLTKWNYRKLAEESIIKI